MQLPLTKTLYFPPVSPQSPEKQFQPSVQLDAAPFSCHNPVISHSCCWHCVTGCLLCSYDKHQDGWSCRGVIAGRGSPGEIRGRKSHMGPVNDSPAVKWTRVIRLRAEVGSSSAAVVWSCDAFCLAHRKALTLRWSRHLSRTERAGALELEL